MTTKLIVVPGTHGGEGHLGLLQDVLDLLHPNQFDIEVLDYPASMLYPCSYYRSIAVGVARLSNRLKQLEAAGSPYTILGYSQGAEVAVRTLLRHPHRHTRLRRAVLLAAPVRFTADGTLGILGSLHQDMPDYLAAKITEIANPADVIAAAADGSIYMKIARYAARIGGSNWHHSHGKPEVSAPAGTLRSRATEAARALLMRRFSGLLAHTTYSTSRPEGGKETYTQLAAGLLAI